MRCKCSIRKDQSKFCVKRKFGMQVLSGLKRGCSNVIFLFLYLSLLLKLGSSLDLQRSMSSSEKEQPTETEAAMQLDSAENRSCIFYKLMVDSIIQDKELGIPKKFIQRLGEKVSSFVTLIDSNSDKWLIGLRKVDQKLWLSYGWEKFVDHHSLHPGCFLIFKYQGNSTFAVYIYDLAVSEMKVSPKVGFTSHESTQGKQVQAASFKYSTIWQNVDLLSTDTASGCPKDRHLSKCTVAKRSSLTVAENIAARDTSVQVTETDLLEPQKETYINFSQEANTNCKKRLTSDTDAPFGTETERESMELPIEAFPLRWRRRSRAVTDEEKRKAVLAIEKFKPTLPFCRVTMRPSYISSPFTLYLPNGFSQKYLKQVQGEIILQDSVGNKWPARYIGSGTSARISKGWRKFVIENNLNVGDICVFELVQEENIVLKVFIFRVVEAEEILQWTDPQLAMETSC